MYISTLAAKLPGANFAFRVKSTKTVKIMLRRNLVLSVAYWTNSGVYRIVRSFYVQSCVDGSRHVVSGPGNQSVLYNSGISVVTVYQ